MKIKHLFVFILILSSTNTTFSQVINVFQNSNYYSAIYVQHEGTRSVVDLSTVKGSPYEDKVFQKGTILNGLDQNPQTYFIRYNIFNDVIELKENTSSSKIIGLLKSSNIYAIVNNKEYHYEIYSTEDNQTDEGYFILLTKSLNSNLYLKKIKKFKGKVPAKDSFHKEVPATFTDSKQFYLKKGGILFPLSTKKKDLFKQFPEKENELKEYMKSEKINLKDKGDLINLFKYYDSLLN